MQESSQSESAAKRKKRAKGATTSSPFEPLGPHTGNARADGLLQRTSLRGRAGCAGREAVQLVREKRPRTSIVHNTNEDTNNQNIIAALSFSILFSWRTTGREGFRFAHVYL
jgi:hypothetical protein